MEKGSVDSRRSFSVFEKRFSVVNAEAVSRCETASYGRLATPAASSDESDVVERRLQIVRTTGMTVHVASRTTRFPRLLAVGCYHTGERRHP
jgi:hypothetical protein